MFVFLEFFVEWKFKRRMKRLEKLMKTHFFIENGKVIAIKVKRS